MNGLKLYGICRETGSEILVATFHSDGELRELWEDALSKVYALTRIEYSLSTMSY